MKKILTIMSETKPFAMIEPYLKTQGMQVSCVPNLPEAVKKIQTEPWDVILISWNLPLIDVKKTYEFLNSKLASLVVVFSESDKSNVVKQFMASGIKTTMYPPLSGPGVQKRIETLLKHRDADGPPQGDMGIVAVGSKEVPKDIEWEAQGPAQINSGDRLWQAVSKNDESITFVYQGVEAPKFDENNGWNTNGKSVLKVTSEARSTMGSVFGQPIQKKAKVTVLGLEKKERKYQMPTTNEGDGSAMFYATLTAALDVIKGVFCDPAEIDQDMDKIAYTWVKSDTMSGMVIVGDPSESQEALDLLEGLQGEMTTEFEQKNEKFELLMNKAIVNIAPTNPNMWLSRKTKYVYGVKSPNNKMVMAFMPMAKDIEYALDETGEYYAISVEKAFRVGTKTPCDFFMFMKKNQKFVRYISKDQMINEGTITKLTNNQITNVMIPKTDLQHYLAYKSRYQLGIK